MTKGSEDSKIEDDFLKDVFGGDGMGYGMENTVLYDQFSSFWENKKAWDNAASMDSRGEFVRAYSQGISDGTPSNIAEWYRRYIENYGDH